MSRGQSYIQVRIEDRTKKQAQKVLGDLGLDLTTAVKMLCKQIVHTGTLPLELRDLTRIKKVCQYLGDVVV